MTVYVVDRFGSTIEFTRAIVQEAVRVYWATSSGTSGVYVLPGSPILDPYEELLRRSLLEHPSRRLDPLEELLVGLDYPTKLSSPKRYRDYRLNHARVRDDARLLRSSTLPPLRLPLPRDRRSGRACGRASGWRVLRAS